MVSNLTLYVFVGGLVQLVAGEAFMSVRFLTFRNPRGRGSNRHCCDGRFFFCVSPCDHHFTLCLDQIDGPPRNVNHCTYGKASSGEIANRNYINFEQKIGRLPNPYIWRLSSWPGQVRLKINIVDIDDHNDNDHVDFLYKVIATEPTKSIVGYRYKLRNNVELSLEVRVYCGKDFYGLNCSVYCHARDDDFLGHYTCDRQSGSKICMKGWIGDHCVFNEDNCKGVTCHNGGQCLDLHNDFSCKCPKGFLGRFCEVDTDECLDPSLCLHGDCVNNPGSFTCDCHKGYTGAMCDENIDDCKSLPCLNGGICNDLIGNYSCKCVVGFTGLVCETDVDECDFEPCANNATCVNTVGAYKCDCLPGYRGNDCSLDVNECLRRPCLNGGTCNNYRGAYECECLEGFEGTICESDIDECQVTDSLCQNNGTCHNSHGGYSCECNQGYQGQLCENDVDECERYPCEHGGQCQNLPGTFSCECQNGYTGELCETNIDECESNICQHGGNCTDLDGSFLCQCTPFWEGATCSDNVDECLSYPCQNNGQCQNAEEGFNCVCLRGFLGNLCQEDLDECEMDGYCVNNSTCVNSLGGYTCECQDGWRGQHCEEDINECEKYGCHNLGTCVNVEGSFLCLCPINWMGQRCEIDVDECQEEYNPCRNNGTCTNLIGTYQCYCTQGWTGILCDTDINECEEDLQLCSIRGNSSIDKYNSTDTDQHMVCLNTQPGYACLCAPGWTGELCDVDIDECSVGTTESNLDDLHQSTPVNTEDDGVSSTVENQHDTGDSVSSLNQSAPNITDGNENIIKDSMEILDYNHTYTTIRMASDSQDMYSQTQSRSPACLNGGVCSNTLGSFHCACSGTWSGKRCQFNMIDCNTKHICGKFGHCVNDSVLTCKCQEGWTGSKCDKKSVCHDSLCKNGGICQIEQDSGSATCKCFKGWTGEFCNECGHGTCLNGGECVLDSGNDKRCQCAQGWTGISCDTANATTMATTFNRDNSNRSIKITGDSKAECDKLNCQNNSTCVSHGLPPFITHCHCRDGWFGHRCQYESRSSTQAKINISTTAISSTTSAETQYLHCTREPCHNSGLCIDFFKKTFYCACKEGWTGRVCSEPIKSCGDLLCFNQGRCVTVGDGTSKCVCPLGWQGKDCLDDTDECLTSPCKNRGICVNTKGFFFCKCQGMWVGKDCSDIEISLPIYVACQINESNKWAVNKGLKKMFIDSGLFDGKKLKVDHKSEVGTSEKGDIITSIYPIISEDQRPLTDQEIIHVISRFTYKFRDYIFCPLFLDSVGGRYSFSSQPLNSETANWYPGLITACVLLVVVGLVLALVKCRRGKLCCASNYNLETEDERNRSFRNEVYTDSIFAIAQSDDHYTPSDIQQPNRMDDTSSLVEPNSREMRTPLHITNPLYSTLDEADEEEEMRQGTEDRQSSDTSVEDSPDGQPSEDKTSQVTSSQENTEGTLHDTSQDSTNDFDAQSSPYEAETLSRYENVEGHKGHDSISSPESESSLGQSDVRESGETYLKMAAIGNVDDTNDGEDHYSCLDEEKIQRRERRSARRKRALDTERDKYKNLPFIDDPTYATVGSRGGNSSP